jgi:hypothetical protein
MLFLVNYWERECLLLLFFFHLYFPCFSALSFFLSRKRNETLHRLCCTFTVFFVCHDRRHWRKQQKTKKTNKQTKQTNKQTMTAPKQERSTAVDAATPAKLENNASSPYEHFKSSAVMLVDGTMGKAWYVTVATKPNHNLVILQSLCTELGNHLNVMGQGDMRLQRWGQNFGVKIFYLNDFFENPPSTYKPTDIVIFSDAYDVFILSSLEKAVRRFHKHDADVLISAERYCHPDASRANCYPSQSGSYPYLCSGLFMGYGGTLARIMRKHTFEIACDDQRYWTTAYLENVDVPGIVRTRLVHLDTEATIFLNAAGRCDDIYIEHNPFDKFGIVRNDRTKNSPCFIHFNGTANQIIPFLLVYSQNTGTMHPYVRHVKRRNSRLHLFAFIIFVCFLLFVIHVIRRSITEQSTEKPNKPLTR